MCGAARQVRGALPQMRRDTLNTVEMDVSMHSVGIVQGRITGKRSPRYTETVTPPFLNTAPRTLLFPLSKAHGRTLSS